MNKKAFLVAQREFADHLKTKAFWLGILLFPVLITLSIAIPTWLEDNKEARLYAVVDRSDWLLGEIEAGLTADDESSAKFVRVQDAGDDIAELNRRITEQDLFAYFVIGEDPVGGDSELKYVSTNLTDTDLREWFSERATNAVRERRLAAKDIDPTVATWVQTPLRFEMVKIGRGGSETTANAQDRLRQRIPVAFVYILWMAVLMNSQILLTTTIEEKSSRIMEVLLSSVSPVELMVGKIVGIAAVGMTVLATWVLSFILAVNFVPKLMGSESPLDFAAVAADPLYLTSFLVYFLLGYLLFAALLVGIGSVCNSLQEAQNLQQPVILVLFVPLATMVPIVKDPNSMMAKVMSFIPPFTPFVMMNRAGAPPTILEYVGTTLLLVASIVFMLWAAAKVFRVGILMTGKPPRVTEILRWIRAPVGLVPERSRTSG